MSCPGGIEILFSVIILVNKTKKYKHCSIGSRQTLLLLLSEDVVTGAHFFDMIDCSGNVLTLGPWKKVGIFLRVQGLTFSEFEARLARNDPLSKDGSKTV